MKSKLTFTDPEQAFLEHRKFSRVALSMLAFIEQNNQHQDVEITDISLKGVAINHRHDAFNEQDPVTLHIHLSPKALVSMELHCVHSEENHAGFCCDFIDDVSLAHLSHLISESMNNQQQFQQEFHLLRAQT